ncbi:MAG TPA: 4-(cytidine 5'-diphospho)-2-C-methyl-D-erythritol kinase [Pyrinomonadaceae bacterium]|nr:4-(cytidine 5'-diphospho)-2-C-methyl-D-erythritol kinase [Pyrinomonadaceae bacterium]
MREESFTLPAFAKINLDLRILGRRPSDNFHEIRTVVQTITLRDQLTFQKIDDGRIELTCSDPGIPSDERNLVYCAALSLRHRYGVQEGALVRLEKRIPAQAGLGGGSSDAAVALLGLSRLWKLKISRDDLVNIGAELGTDVPFFFTGGTALGTGLGTNIYPLNDAPHRNLLVIMPGVKVSTADAYTALDAPTLTKADSAAILPVSYADTQISDSLYDVMRNDFEPVIYKLYPEIERTRRALAEAGARKVLLAGSGASVFGVFDDDESCERARGILKNEGDWQAFVCATVSRGSYRNALGRCAEFLQSSTPKNQEIGA